MRWIQDGGNFSRALLRPRPLRRGQTGSAGAGGFQKPERHRVAPILCLCAALLFLAGWWPGAAQAASFNHNSLQSGSSQAARQAAQSEAYRSALAERTELAANVPQDAAEPAFEFKIKDLDSIPWRLRIFDAASVSGPVVLLGEIAAPVGEMPEELWRELSGRALWSAPEESGRPMNLTRPRLQQAMVSSMGREFAALCFYPSALIVQRGGSVLSPAEVLDLTVKALTPLLAGLPGEASLSDFRLPGNVFLAASGQTLELEAPGNVAPGRLSLRYTVRELDGSVVRRLTGTVFIDCWAVVPCAASALGRDEVLEPAKITFQRKNLAQTREEIWDGKGGPWRLTRAVPADQPILISDLTHVPTMVKGSNISLVYQSSGVRLSVKAQALADGVKGESVPVRNLASGRQVYATIIDENTALIEAGFSRSTAENVRAGFAGTRTFDN